MPKEQKSGITINITSTMNGFTVSGHPAGMHDWEEDVSYVYKSMDEVIKNLPSIYSVLQQEKKKPKNEKDLKQLEKEANKAGKE